MPVQQTVACGQQSVGIECSRVTGQGPGRIAKWLACHEVGRVGDDQIIGFGVIILNGALYDGDPAVPGEVATFSLA